jgi:hypothetical protein
VLFGLAFGLKSIYVRLSGSNPFMLTAKRAVVLFIFMKLVDSFGMDWVLLETLPLVAAVYGYSLLFGSRRMAAEGGASVDKGGVSIVTRQGLG